MLAFFWNNFHYFHLNYSRLSYEFFNRKFTLFHVKDPASNSCNQLKVYKDHQRLYYLKNVENLSGSRLRSQESLLPLWSQDQYFFLTGEKKYRSCRFIVNTCSNASLENSLTIGKSSTLTYSSLFTLKSQFMYIIFKGKWKRYTALLLVV